MNCSIPYAILLSGPKICTHSGFTPCANAGTAKTTTRIRATTTTAHSLVVVGCTTGSLHSMCPIFLAKFFASTTLTKNMTGNNKAVKGSAASIHQASEKNSSRKLSFRCRELSETCFRHREFPETHRQLYAYF